MASWRLCIAAAALVLAALACGAAAQDGPVRVDNSTKFFVTPDGRARLFHGVNAVYKVPPWHPETQAFNTDTSLSAEDIADLAAWGFNVVRLGVMWPGVVPQAGAANATYLATMQQLVADLGAAGIYTIVDCHQDLFSRYFCGEGAPDWATPQHSLLGFPGPVGEPNSIELNPVTGYPNLTQCLEKPFFEYYFSAAVGNAFQELYDNTRGLQDEFAAYWQAVAAAFADSPYVLGYEIINEPWAGDIYKHPKALLEPGYADQNFLFPLYQNIYNAIREVDTEHIVFFESAVSDEYPCGFPSGPGGPEADEVQAYSYHVYCGPTDANGDPTKPLLCNYTDDYLFDVKQYDHKRMGLAGFMTEFGALLGTQVGVDSLHYLLGKADHSIQSWAYWQYKSYKDVTTASPSGAESFYVNGTLDTAKVRALSRTYARATAGVPTVQFFDPVTAIFQLGYDIVSGLASDVTEIYINAEYYYPNGYTIDLTEGLKQVQSPDPSLIWISNGNATNHALITINPTLVY